MQSANLVKSINNNYSSFINVVTQVICHCSIFTVSFHQGSIPTLYTSPTDDIQSQPSKASLKHNYSLIQVSPLQMVHLV